MAITFPTAFPLTPPRHIEWGLLTVGGVAISPITLAQQASERAGNRWLAAVQYAPLKRPEAAPLIAVLVSLDGKVNTVLFGPAGAEATPQGIATGSPQINGGGQTGKVLKTRGWTASQSGILKAADWLAVGRNYLTYPAEMDNAIWVKNTATVAANSQTAPDGTATADRVTPTSDGASLWQAATLPSGVSIVGRVFKVGIWLRAAAGTPNIHNLYVVNQTGTLRGSVPLNLTTSWQHFSVSGTMLAGDTTVGLIFGGTNWTVADGAVDAWGAYLDSPDQNQRLHMMGKDGASDSNGLADLDVRPPMRGNMDDFAPVVTLNPKGVFRLKENIRKWDVGLASIYGVVFELEEAF